MTDLVVLTADKPMESTVDALLERTSSMGLRSVRRKFIRHHERDSGVRTNGHELLRRVAGQYEHALMLCDLEGSGSSAGSAVELERELDAQLSTSWKDRAKSIVIEPELDVWMWGSDARLVQTLKWPYTESPRRWLVAQGFSLDEEGKPIPPKDAMKAVLDRLRLPMSAAVYGRIASEIGLARCTDAAFIRLRDVLRSWFSAQ